MLPLFNALRPRLITSVMALAVAFFSEYAPALRAQSFDAEVTPHSETLLDGQIQVPAARQYVLSFTTRSNYRNARIAGSVQAAGGSGNDIRVLVRKGASTVFDSGQRRSVVLSVDFSQPGIYTLVFDNGFSPVSPKVVSAKILLVHWGIDVSRNEQDQQEALAHYTQATRVLGRLYATLKASERVWGTSQLGPLPTVRLNAADHSVNAAASWSTNVITVNEGMFDLTDRMGASSDDVLAATLAHELSHIFYHHPGYGSSSQGVNGFLSELEGVTALDRVQEQEADSLGLRMMCAAGFDSQGMLILTGISILASQLSVVYSNHLDCDQVFGSASPKPYRPAMKSGR